MDGSTQLAACSIARSCDVMLPALKWKWFVLILLLNNIHISYATIFIILTQTISRHRCSMDWHHTKGLPLPSLDE